MRKGRPPTQWLELKGLKQRTITLREIACLVGVDPSSVSRSIKRIGVVGELRKDGQQYVMTYKVNEIRTNYAKALRHYMKRD